jgi:hypothetical protein
MLTKYNVSEIGFYLRPQVEPTQLGPIDKATMDNVQEYNICTNLPSSQTLRSYDWFAPLGLDFRVSTGFFSFRYYVRTGSVVLQAYVSSSWIGA